MHFRVIDLKVLKPTWRALKTFREIREETLELLPLKKIVHLAKNWNSTNWTTTTARIERKGIFDLAHERMNAVQLPNFPAKLEPVKQTENETKSSACNKYVVVYFDCAVRRRQSKYRSFYEKIFRSKRRDNRAHYNPASFIKAQQHIRQLDISHNSNRKRANNATNGHQLSTADRFIVLRQHLDIACSFHDGFFCWVEGWRSKLRCPHRGIDIVVDIARAEVELLQVSNSPWNGEDEKWAVFSANPLGIENELPN